ncbi:hypothetical protein [Candidatus Hodarchaeum mangrovi]
MEHVQTMYYQKIYQLCNIQDQDILNYLTKRNGSPLLAGKASKKEFFSRLDKLKQKAQFLFQPKSIYSIFNRSDLPARECFEEVKKVALVIVTLGKALPEEVNNLMVLGKYLDGVILDAIGSAGVEYLADIVDSEIHKLTKRSPFECSRRYSPGYCNWDLRDQELIFKLLPAHKIEVHLTSGYLMVPIKSISFAINIAENIRQSRWENRCIYCKTVQCSYRMK